MTKIQILAFKSGNTYSVGEIHVTKKGDVYFITKLPNVGLHNSRHSSGAIHTKVKGYPPIKIRESLPIKEFKGIEFMATLNFSLNLLDKTFKVYKNKGFDGIFVIDVKDYEEGKLNLVPIILTQEGLPQLFESMCKYQNRHLVVFGNCKPMIALLCCNLSDATKK